MNPTFHCPTFLRLQMSKRRVRTRRISASVVNTASVKQIKPSDFKKKL